MTKMNFPPQGDLTAHYKTKPFFSKPMIAIALGTLISTLWAPAILLPLLLFFAFILLLIRTNNDRIYDQINKQAAKDKPS